ncbi:NmrA/HSCARG family protein [Promicromonospora vindobonensis]|uniref:NmrA/HSCARG family protein n=1 Tax=Promicromonospora vindobonensis TaxID=195748 RepID=A0ABW5VTX0_9MICO
MNDTSIHQTAVLAQRAGTERTIAVLGATGQQGGSVTAALLADGWTVRAVVRDPSGERARSLAAAGVEIVRGDLADPQSLRAAFVGVHGVFSVQPSSGQAGTGLSDEDEVRYGTTVAEAAQHSGVAHLVYSSMIAAGPTPTGVRHFDVKSRIEDRVRSLDTDSTIIRPATFMELLLTPGMGLDRGALTFLMRPEQEMQFIAVRDIGRVVAEVFDAPERFADRTVEIAGDALTGNAIAHQLAHVAGRPITYNRLPQAVLEQDDVLARSAALVDDGRLAGSADLAELRTAFPFLLRFDRWLAGPAKALLTDALGLPRASGATR